MANRLPQRRVGQLPRQATLMPDRSSARDIETRRPLSPSTYRPRIRFPGVAPRLASHQPSQTVTGTVSTRATIACARIRSAPEFGDSVGNAPARRRPKAIAVSSANQTSTST